MSEAEQKLVQQQNNQVATSPPAGTKTPQRVWCLYQAKQHYFP